MRKQRLRDLRQCPEVLPPELDSRPVKVKARAAVSLRLSCLPGSLQPEIC